jgi:hypothetical protein
MEKRILDAIEAAQESFWLSIAAAFPEATSGDFPPDADLALREAMTTGVTLWVNCNVVQAPEVQDVQAVVDDVLERAKTYGFKPDREMVRDAVTESASLLNLQLSEDQIAEACGRIMERN